MSYLLDALNKSKGDQPNQAAQSNYNDVPQPMMYPSYAPGQGSNIYKWISIVLALVLTLIVGIVLGNKYALLGVPNTNQSQAQQNQQQAQPLATQLKATKPTPEPQITQPVTRPLTEQPITEQPITEQPIQQQTPAQSTLANSTPANSTAAPTNQSNSEQLIAQQQTEQTQQQPMIVGYQPEQQVQQTPTQTQAKDPGLENISNDLLSKFNQAIKESEGVEQNYSEQINQQTDQEIDEYLALAPRITELTTQQQMQIPAMVYETHLYSSDRFQRWVKINGRTMQETQWITENIQIHEIQKQFLILDMGHIRFRLPALTDWAGYGQ